MISVLISVETKKENIEYMGTFDSYAEALGESMKLLDSLRGLNHEIKGFSFYAHGAPTGTLKRIERKE